MKLRAGSKLVIFNYVSLHFIFMYKLNQTPYTVNYKTSNTICTGMLSANSEVKKHVGIVLGLPLIMQSLSWFTLSCYM